MLQYSGLHFRSNIADSVDFHGNCVLATNVTLTQSACIASRLQRIPGHVISMKLHPQEVLATDAKSVSQKTEQKCNPL